MSMENMTFKIKNKEDWEKYNELDSLLMKTVELGMGDFWFDLEWRSFMGKKGLYNWVFDDDGVFINIDSLQNKVQQFIETTLDWYEVFQRDDRKK
jgi:hypothetical protein